MRTISLVTSKGGSGKSTLALSLAVAAQEAGERAVVVDLDPQRTAGTWYLDRDAEEPLVVEAKSTTDLPKILEAAKAKGYTVAFLDAPGWDGLKQGAAIMASDLCLVPCRPTPNDLKTTPATASVIAGAGKPIAFVLNQTPARGFRTPQARGILSTLGMVSPVHVALRTAFQDAVGLGLGVTEREPKGKGADEIRALWKWTAGRLGRLENVA